MTAVVSRSRWKSTWLTGAAGLLLVSAAFVMMICAAPRARAPLRGDTVPAATQSVTTWCGQPTWSGDQAKVRVCRLGPSALSAWTGPRGSAVIAPTRPASQPARPSGRDYLDQP
jgi:hypothetical protein